MTPFLKQVAGHYQAGSGKLERLCFIFPNRRALSFFRKYLSEEIAAHSDVPVISPQMLTMNDFFYRISGAGKTDKVHLLLELHKQYVLLNPQKAEELDDFIFWGDVILSDFDDVDKYLVNPEHLFANVVDFKSLQDSFSYLTPAQLDAINRFLGHFRNGSELTVDLDADSDYKGRFLRIWDILLPLYRNFRKALLDQGLSYEGQVYRDTAERLDSEAVVDMLAESFPDTDSFVFVGLNALNECEKKVMRRMHSAGVAEFCWDYSSKWIRDRHNKSSFFMDVNVTDFPQAFKPDQDGLPEQEFNVVSVPSGIGGAKQLPAILDRISAQTGRVPGIDTAIVLPDEKMLIPVLNSIPAEISDLNVTMGYPMGASELWNLMNDVAGLQMHVRVKDGVAMFYHRQVWALFSNSIIKNVLSGQGEAAVKNIREGLQYYIPQEAFAGDPVLEAIFRPVVTRSDVKDASLIRAIGTYQQQLLSVIAPLLKGREDMAMELDFAREYHLAVGRLMAHDLEVLPATYFRLLNQLVGTASVPFQGEPLAGLQIMGPLETRALDFDNLIILNCNEGVFPRRSVSSSFVPPELRRGFGLPTYEFQDAMWAYYFYRMIQRSRRVWMLFDSRSEGTRTGEQSRYIRQLELHFGAKVNHYVVKAPIGHVAEQDSIPKTDGHIAELHEHSLSASALQNYLSCQAKFYYHSVCHLKEENEVSESLDAGMLGTVFHSTMEGLYEGRKTVTAEYLDSILKDSAKVHRMVSAKIMEMLHSFEVTGRNIIFEDVVCQYVLKAVQRDRELLDEYKVREFTIHGLELQQRDTIGGFKFVGFIDRLDSFRPDELRVVDYKTGKVTDQDFNINADNAEKVVAALFGNNNANRPKIALQLYLYDRFVRDYASKRGMSVVNSIYQTSRLFVNPVEKVSLDETFCELMEKEVSELLERISDTSNPWMRTTETKTCETCDFKMICGR